MAVAYKSLYTKQVNQIDLKQIKQKQHKLLHTTLCTKLQVLHTATYNCSPKTTHTHKHTQTQKHPYSDTYKTPTPRDTVQKGKNNLL